jgi:hypothetical protein
VQGYRWANDRYLLVTLGSRENIFGQRADLRRVATYDTQTGKTIPLAWRDATGDAGDILYIDKKNARVLLARQVDTGDTERMFKYRVEWVDVATGNVKNIVQTPNPVVDGWYADGNGVVRMGTSSDGDTGQETYLYRSGTQDSPETEGQRFLGPRHPPDRLP